MDLITEARELCERATPGPWESGSYGAVCLKSGFKLGNIEGSGNADFIARSRTLIPELCDALEKAEAEIARLREAQRWIPVTGRLPERHQTVLAHYESGKITTDFYGNRGWTFLNYGEVTHWMPLPEPPGKGE